MRKIEKGILRYIEKMYQENEETELAEYIQSNVDNIMTYCDACQDDRDSFVDDFCSFTSYKYNKLGVFLLENNIDFFSRVKIEERQGIYYISLSNYGKNSNQDIYEKYFEILTDMSNSIIKNKGYLYELFCAKWLQEYCNQVIVTSKAKDKGIDIVGQVNTHADFVEMKDINIQVLVQCKFSKQPTDVPVIRHLVGDSLIQTFSRDEYNILKPTILCVISHMGFTKNAIKFAEENNILLLCSEQMLRLLELRGSLEKFECVKYLESIKGKME